MNRGFGNLGGSRIERVRGLLSPSGSAVLDGARLAVINSLILFGLFVLARVFSLSRALFGWFVPVPTLFFGFFMILLTVAGFSFVWFRYTSAHRSVAFRQAGVNAGTFGLIAASPFVVLALMLFGSGLLALFFGLISFSSGRVGSAVLRLFYAMLFVLLAIANYLTARFAARE